MAVQLKVPFRDQKPAGNYQDFIANIFEVSGNHLEVGTTEFEDYAVAMVDELGHEVIPHLKSVFNSLRDHPGIRFPGMTPGDEVNACQLDFLFDEVDDSSRTLLDQLLEDSRLFKKSDDYKELLDFIICMPNFAPFNAMLLQIQKPGLRYAASAWDWRRKFGRTIKEDARPLLILWPFGPVALVYDLLDTEGEELPKHVYAFPAKGLMTKDYFFGFVSLIAMKGVETEFVDKGDNKAGSIRAMRRAAKPKEKPLYIIKINQNHNPNTQFATLAHELAHLFLGHLGMDKALKIPDRIMTKSKWAELEAESVSYLVCSRHGVETSSESYLAKYVNENHTVDQLDMYRVMKAAGQVENLLGLGSPTKFPKINKQ